ncbi:MAG: recombinase family protein [Clostridium sp.]|uniref:recombinase family protein n=1 Tax=Clostridium sp. TaxID=1506 RepID=UPI003056C0FC
MKRVAIYCRVSSDDQKERETIENQVDILKTYIEMKEDLELACEYLDDGVSGTVEFEKRPTGKLLIDKASEGEFDAILVYKIDRFGRDTLSGLSAVEVLRTYNIEIISLTEPFDLNTPTGRFQFITYLNMAELERNNILDRMFLGASRAAKQGRWLGGIVPFGYFVNKDKYLEINEDEAVIVRKIFDMYVEDKKNSLDITIYLNSTGIPTNYAARGTGKRNKNEKQSLWSVSTIQRILANTTYMGRHEYGKRSTRRTELIVRSVPAIVPIEVFESAKELRLLNSKNSKRNSPNRDFLLRTLIKCGECKRTYYGVFYRNSPSVYSCSGKKSLNKKLYNTNCHNLNVVADTLEKFVWNICREILVDFDGYVLDDDKTNEESELNMELEFLNKQIIELNNEKSNILKLFRKNIITDAELEEQLADIKKDLTKHDDIIKAVKNKMSIFNDKHNVINKFKNNLEFYKNRVDTLNNSEKTEVIRLLVKCIDIIPIIDNGTKSSEYRIEWNLSDLAFEPSWIQCCYKHKVSGIYNCTTNSRQFNFSIF